MNLPWGDERGKQFVTSVGLITSTGPHGPNVMSAEWTHHLSYEPGLIGVCVRPGEATHDNIERTKEFGVSIAADNQSMFVSVAGNHSGHTVDKVSVLRELGCVFTPSTHIKAPLVEGAAMKAECRVVQSIMLGDHTMFVGEVQEASVTPGKIPLVYSGGKFRRFGDQIKKPPEEELDRIKALVLKYAKKS